MSEEEKPEKPEIPFLPPLKMLLAFFDREARKRGLLKKDDTRPVNTKVYDVRRIIERLSKDDQDDDTPVG